MTSAIRYPTISNSIAGNPLSSRISRGSRAEHRRYNRHNNRLIIINNLWEGHARDNVGGCQGHIGENGKPRL